MNPSTNAQKSGTPQEKGILRTIRSTEANSWKRGEIGIRLSLLIAIGNQSQKYTSNLLTAGTWLHVAVVRSSNTFKLYLNGTHLTPDVVISANEGNLPGGASTLRLGMRTDAATINDVEAQFFGFVDDVAVFNKALNQAEITQIINEPDGRLLGTEPNLLAAWIFDKMLPPISR
jgi:hypothetical protein